MSYLKNVLFLDDSKHIVSMIVMAYALYLLCFTYKKIYNTFLVGDE
jgi:hypothetical protein